MSTENSSDLQETAYQQRASLDHANTQAPKMSAKKPQLTGMCKSYALTYLQVAKSRLSEAEFVELRSLMKLKGITNEIVVPKLAKISCLLQDYPHLMRGFRAFLAPGLQLPFQTGVFLLLYKNQIEERESSSDVNCKLEKMSNSPPEEQMFETSTSQGTNSNLFQSDSLDTREDQNLLKKINEKCVNSFLYKVKDRFKEEPQIYEKFKEILHFMSSRNQIEIDGLLEILDLFQGHEDLIAEFKSFIPNIVQESPSGQQEEEEKEEEEEEDASDTVPTVQDENSTSQHDSTDISRITAVNDPSIASVYKYGTYENFLFFDKTLKKCQTVVKHRKEHNLKFKNVVLPTDLFESGYHGQCYKPFTGLMKKYYSSKASTTEKSTPEENSENVTKNSSLACLSTSELNPQLSSPATSSVPESIIISELVEPVTSNFPENTVQPENIDSPSETNTLVESDVSTDKSVEELETEATYTSVQNSSICPETIVKSPLMCTGVAFDNFDHFVETKSGKDTLHDTVGIIYQNVDLHTPYELQLVNLFAVNNEETVISKKRRHKTFEAI
ncbi:paired amphipathic helix protein Sin3b [Trichonephila clavipes]|nr:paired amphipathic helix protein Sin3b [Trichonephila clavipes]